MKGKGKGSVYSSRPSAVDRTQSSSSSWADLDLSVIVAFVSPIGNWLTGGDHIKNLFLIILLIFYLHQLIEIPWRLYQASLPHKPSHSPNPASTDPQTARLVALARTELHRQELFYLVLTVVSPLLGAAFLQHIADALGGTQALSWFSTTLFVLATGLRPWSHLVARLRDRTNALHNAVHYPPPAESEAAATAAAQERAFGKALTRLSSVERQLADLRARAARGDKLQGVCDDLSEAIGDLERNAKRGERKSDSTRSELSARIAALEAGLLQVEERRRKDTERFKAGLSPLPPAYALTFARAHNYVSTIVGTLIRMPKTLWSLGMKELSPEKPATSPQATGRTNGHVTSPIIREGTRHAPRLATIPEAEHSDADSDGTYVSDPEKERDKEERMRSRSRSHSGGSGRAAKAKARARSYSYSEKGFEVVQGLMLWPYRASVRVLVAVMPPVKKILPVL
ncbi:hypothetical protein BKA93DRAFT_724892 [Sparassis latifolia]